ncbi:hypothetical protein XJ32_04570 [Helicobacter bilis]|uniref:Uncharacterized protein n=1 Tax=Helicobacter bilis TaxID=37372 RepID=A0A1Q2LGG7_9HELI|nr:hypothetical protein [Helicobacter bilis]AQQ59489.1 hypothetical protein XJ32_04570 [Helicobacter bilis]
MDTQELIKQYVKIVSDTHFERGKQIVSKRLNITEEEAEALSQTDEFKEIGELKRKFDDKKRPDTDKKVKLLFNNFEDFYNWLKSQ